MAIVKMIPCLRESVCDKRDFRPESHTLCEWLLLFGLVRHHESHIFTAWNKKGVQCVREARFTN